MKTIKWRAQTALFILSCLAAASCSSESDYIYTDELWVGRATVVIHDNDFSLQTDGGHNLYIVSNFAEDYVPTDNQRAFVKYSVLDRETGTDNYKVHLYDIKNILTKSVADRCRHVVFSGRFVANKCGHVVFLGIFSANRCRDVVFSGRFTADRCGHVAVL